MRKAILFASLISLGAFAAEDKKGGQAEFTPSGEFRARYTNEVDADFNQDAKPGTEGMVETRFKLGGTFRLGEKISGHIGTIHSTQMGKGNDTTDAPAVSGEYTSNSADNNLMVNEAYGNWMLNDEMSFKVGRFNLEIADGAVISKDDYLQKPTALEGVLFTYDTEFAKFTGMAIKHYDFGGNDDDEGNTYGLSVDVKSVPDALKMVNIHLLQTNVDEQAATTGVSTLRYGLTVGGDAMNILYKLTYAGYSGTLFLNGGDNEVDLTGSMMDLYVGYQVPDLMKFKVWVGYHTDSGDDDSSDNAADGGEVGTYSPFLYDQHAYAGLMDAVAWGNLTETFVKLSIDPMENLSVALGYHMFSMTENDGTTNSTNPLTGTTLAAGDNTAIGNEIDLVVTQKYDNGVNVGFRYSTLAPGDAVVVEDTYTNYQLFGQVAF